MCWPSLELPYSAEKKNKKNCMKNMITVVSSRRALFPFLLLCWLVVKSTILVKTEEAGTKYKTFEFVVLFSLCFLGVRGGGVSLCLEKIKR